MRVNHQSLSIRMNDKSLTNSAAKRVSDPNNNSTKIEFANIGASSDATHQQGRCDTKDADTAVKQPDKALHADPNRTTLIRELTHDWLMYHSTHTEQRRPHCIRLLLRKLPEETLLSDFLHLNRKHPAATRHMHDLPEYINQCLLKQENKKLNMLLTLYIDARTQARRQKVDSSGSLQVKRHGLPKTRWQQWLTRLDGMSKRPIKRRIKRNWLGRRHFDTSRPPHHSKAVGHRTPCADLRRGLPAKKYLQPPPTTE